MVSLSAAAASPESKLPLRDIISIEIRMRDAASMIVGFKKIIVSGNGWRRKHHRSLVGISSNDGSHAHMRLRRDDDAA